MGLSAGLIVLSLAHSSLGSEAKPPHSSTISEAQRALGECIYDHLAVAYLDGLSQQLSRLQKGDPRGDPRLPQDLTKLTHIHSEINIPPNMPRSSLDKSFTVLQYLPGSIVMDTVVNGSQKFIEQGPQLRKAVIRERGTELGDHVMGDDPGGNLEWGYPIFNIEQIRKSLRENRDDTYRRYSLQGPERSSIVGRVQQQDKEDLHNGRVTSFILYDLLSGSQQVVHQLVKTPSGPRQMLVHTKEQEGIGQPVGHMQVLVSRSASEKLHVEEEIGAIQRKSDNETIAEVGRLDFIERVNLEPKTSQAVTDFEKRKLIALLFRDIHHWMVNDTEINRAFYQMNKKVYGILKDIGFPVELAKKTEFEKTYKIKENGETKVTEIALEFDRNQMKKVEEAFTIELLKHSLDRFLKQSTSPDDVLHMQFRLNEIPALERIGLIKWVKQEEQSSSLYVHKWISALPNNYHFPLENIGFSLVGGRQLVPQMQVTSNSGITHIKNVRQFRTKELDTNIPLFLLKPQSKERVNRFGWTVSSLNLQFTREAAEAFLRAHP